MKNRLIPCVLACLMIFLVGCNGNTAKEAAQEITKTETSFPAGNTETNSQEKTAEERICLTAYIPFIRPPVGRGVS